MKIVVIGGSGLIGKKLVNNLRQHGHEVVAASPSSGRRRGMIRFWDFKLSGAPPLLSFIVRPPERRANPMIGGHDAN